MAYHELVGVGLTQKQRPLAVYGVSGYNFSTRNRVATVDKSGTVVSLMPADTMTKEQQEHSFDLFYDPIRVRNPAHVIDILSSPSTEYDRQPFAVVGNGHNTTDHFTSLEEWLPLETESLRQDLRQYGPRRNGDTAPTLMAVNVAHQLGGMYALGITTESGKPKIAQFLDLHGDVRKGTTLTLSLRQKKDKIVTPQFRRARDIVKTIKMSGETAKELAAYLFDLMGPHAVSTAAAVWDFEAERWSLAVKNAV